MASSIIQRAFAQGQGIIRLTPTWVPRVFCTPGRRIKLHPDDYYSLGAQRGGINERWFASTTPATNGPLTGPNEGLSSLVLLDGGHTDTVLFRDAVDELKGQLIGERLWKAHGRWPMYSKFFDNKNPLPHHIHHGPRHAANIGQLEKPEAYFFPPQVNNYFGDFPYTFFGFEPGTTKAQVLDCLRAFSKGDNKITTISRAYRLEPGTGWDVPPGVMHAPGSLCTYEPQKASDVFANYESLVQGRVIEEELLWKDTPLEHVGDFEYLLDVIDWELNLDEAFVSHRFMRPKPVRTPASIQEDGYHEEWVCYKSRAFSAKQLTVLPGRTVTLRDNAAYGMIMMQGHGGMGVWEVETPVMIRFGQLTNDEFFVSEEAARAGVTIVNRSSVDPLVMLKHFGPENPDLQQ